MRLDDFVVPYRPDKASFLVTNNHGFTDLDLAVKTETEERVVCADMQPGCKMMLKHNSFRGRVITCCAVLPELHALYDHPCVPFFTHQLLPHKARLYLQFLT